MYANVFSRHIGSSSVCLFSYTPSHTPVACGLPDTAHLPTVGDSP